MKFHCTVLAAAASASVAQAATFTQDGLTIETDTFDSSTITEETEAIDVSSVVQVSGTGVTMCAAKSVGVSTSVYYGPCYADVDYATANEPPPLGYVQQSVNEMMLLRGSSTDYLDAFRDDDDEEDDDDDDDGTSGGGLRGTTVGAVHTADALHTTGGALHTTGGALTSSAAGMSTTAEDNEYVVAEILPTTSCITDPQYLYAYGQRTPGNASVAQALIGVEAAVDDGETCKDQKAFIGTSTYLVLDGEFSATHNQVPIGGRVGSAAMYDVVDARIVDDGDQRDFDTGTYKFSFYGGFYGDDWADLAAEDGVDQLVLRTQLQQHGCSGSCSWRIHFEQDNGGEWVAAPDDGIVEDVTAMRIRARDPDVGMALTQVFKFDTSFRYGTVGLNSASDGLELTDLGEDEVTVNVLLGSDFMYVDFVVPFERVNSSFTYFIYDPSVEAEEDVLSTPDPATTTTSSSSAAAPTTTSTTTSAAAPTTSSTAAPTTTTSSTTAAPTTSSSVTAASTSTSTSTSTSVLIGASGLAWSTTAAACMLVALML